MRHFVEAIAIALIMSMQIEGPAGALGSDDVLFQLSTISALMDGAFDGAMAFGALREHGDFGLGTFDALDGEMVGLDGHFYKVRSDGSVHEVNIPCSHHLRMSYSLIQMRRSRSAAQI
ncbi:MAG: acetolactate decarboxylase [Methanothrix sp.]|nr:acetolactate decarboxylase [Methanothrix sp.]MCX8206793.1 acetolactate decarboxylase [Methanothrix sp.]